MSGYNDFTIAEYFRKQGAEIGENNRLEIRDLGTEPYLIRIGNHCTIAPNVSFMTHDGGTWLFTEEVPSLQKFGAIRISDNCFIGMNSIIMGNVTIGANSIIGAGSIVTKDIPPNVVAAGNPARVISPINAYREKVLRIWEAQKPAGYMAQAKNGVVYTPEKIQEMKNQDRELLRAHLIRTVWKTEQGGTC
jgi:acetyltransferase-like isoleucine patch superfamily enzyme